MFSSTAASLLPDLFPAGVALESSALGPGVMVGISVTALLGAALTGVLGRHRADRRPGAHAKDAVAARSEQTAVRAFARHGPMSHALTGFLAGGAWARPDRALIAALDEIGRHYLTDARAKERRRADDRGHEPDPKLLERLAMTPPRAPKLRWTGDDAACEFRTPGAEATASLNALPSPTPALRFVAASDASDPSHGRAAAATIRRFERIVMGDIPDLPGVWLTQYAQQRADVGAESDALVLLKVHADGVDVEVLSPQSAPVTAEDRTAGHRNGTADRDAAALLKRLLNRRRQPVGTVLLQLDDDLDPPPGCDLPADFTVLATADELEINDALAALGLALATRPDSEREGGDSVALALVGSPAAEGQRVYGRAAADIADRTGVEVRLAGLCSRIQPVRSNHLGTFRDTPAFWDQLAAWTASAVRPAARVERPLQPA